MTHEAAKLPDMPQTSVEFHALRFHLLQEFVIESGNLIAFRWGVPLDSVRGHVCVIQYAYSVLEGRIPRA